MQHTWSEWVGQQLNTLVAIFALGVIGTLALVLRADDVTVPMAALTGIAGLAGNIRTPQQSTVRTYEGGAKTEGEIVNG